MDIQHVLICAAAVILALPVLAVALFLLAALLDFITNISLLLLPLCFFYPWLIWPIAIAWFLTLIAWMVLHAREENSY